MRSLKEVAKQNPLVQEIYRKVKTKPFHGSEEYWEERYKTGGNSGAGSYGRLSLFKAEILNAFVKENKVQSVIEFGCGDGNQTSLAEYPEYIGLDVSRSVLQICIDRFKDDKTKSFFVYDTKAFQDNTGTFSADLTLSLDVIYHLVEDSIFEKYITDLFNASKNFVIIYSSDQDHQNAPHVKQRKFTKWVDANAPGWKLVQKIENPFPYDPKDPDNTSIADFFIFQKGS